MLRKVVPSNTNLVGMVFVIYLFKSGVFLKGELLVLTENINNLVYNLLLVLLAIIFCIIITNLFINFSRTKLKGKYPLIYNLILVIFTIFLVLLFLILIFLLYKLYIIIVYKVLYIIKEYLLKMFGGGGNWPLGPSSGGSGGLGGPGGSPGNQPPSGGVPYWQDRPRTSCGEDCGSEDDPLWECIKGFYQKLELRHDVLKNSSDTYKGKFSWNSHVNRPTGDKKLDFTRHELESFIRLLNSSGKMDYGIIIKKYAYELNDREYAKFEGKLTYRAKKVEMMLYFFILVERIMQF